MSIWRQKWKEYCNYKGRCLTKQRSKLLSIWDRSFLGLRANGRKIVDQQLPTLLDVTCCVRLHTPLLFVAQSLKPVKLFSQKLPTFLLFRDLRIVAQQCWIRLHSRLPTCWGHACSLRTVYKDLWVVSFPRYTAGPNTVGSCYVRLHAALDIKHYVLSTIVGWGFCDIRNNQGLG